MPMQELDISALRGLTTGTAVKKALASAEIPETGGSSLNVPNVSGEASLSKARLSVSEKEDAKGKHKWVFVKPTCVVQTPTEYRGQFINPQFVFDAVAVNTDSEAALNAVSQMMGFLSNLGIPNDRIESLKGSADFFGDAVKLINASSGTRFRYATKQDKRDERYVRYFANGAVRTAAASDAAPAITPDTVEETSQFPEDGNVYKYNGTEHVVSEADNENYVCNLTPVGGGDTLTGISYFNEAGDPQIDYVRDAE